MSNCTAPDSPAEGFHEAIHQLQKRLSGGISGEITDQIDQELDQQSGTSGRNTLADEIRRDWSISETPELDQVQPSKESQPSRISTTGDVRDSADSQETWPKEGTSWDVNPSTSQVSTKSLETVTPSGKDRNPTNEECTVHQHLEVKKAPVTGTAEQTQQSMTGPEPMEAEEDFGVPRKRKIEELSKDLAESTDEGPSRSYVIKARTRYVITSDSETTASDRKKHVCSEKRVKRKSKSKSKSKSSIKDTDVRGKEMSPRSAPFPQDNVMGYNTDLTSDADTAGPKKLDKVKSEVRSKGQQPWGKDTIEAQLRSIPKKGDLYNMAATLVRQHIVEMSEDIDVIRVGSKNFRGDLSGHMKRRVEFVKQATQVMVEKIEEVGDPGYLIRRNLELTAELARAREETLQLRAEVVGLKMIVERLQASVNQYANEKTGAHTAAATGGSPLPDDNKTTTTSKLIPKEITRVSEIKKDERMIRDESVKRGISPSSVKKGTRGTSIGAGSAPLPPEDVILRPSLGGIQKPIPNAVMDQEADQILVQQIETLKQRRAELRRSVKVAPKEAALNKTGPKVIANVQIAPPSAIDSAKPAVVATATTTEWTKVTNKTKKRKAKNKAEAKPDPAVQIVAATRVNQPEGRKLPRPPRTAAVTIKVTNE